MANVAASDVTHLVLKSRTLGDSRKSNLVRLSFGNGTLTYGAGGIPISKAKLGCPVVIESLSIVDKGVSGYEFMYDQSAEKIVMIQSPARTHAHDLMILGGGTIAADGSAGISASSQLVKAAATNGTIAKADSATKGGVMSEALAAAAGAEPSTVAIAAQIIECEVIGW